MSRAPLSLADWHTAHRHRRGKRPAVVIAYVGNRHRPINSVRSLQRKLNQQARHAKRYGAPQ